MTFRKRIQQPQTVLLDGALGTELERRSVALTAPTWSAAALLSHPEVIHAIHAEYVQASAEVLTANTFRTQQRNLPRGVSARQLTQQAVGLAKLAATKSAHPVWVAGSMAPLLDCYSPQDQLDEHTLLREHREIAEHLAAADVDLMLVETQNSIREARTATQAASETGLPVLVSFVCGLDGKLLSGETLSDAACALLPFQPAGILINCLPVAIVPQALAELQPVCAGIPLGAYANAGSFEETRGWQTTGMEQPEAYAASAETWPRLGAKLIGGCCGTTPNHIRALSQKLRTVPSA